MPRSFLIKKERRQASDAARVYHREDVILAASPSPPPSLLLGETRLSSPQPALPPPRTASPAPHPFSVKALLAPSSRPPPPLAVTLTHNYIHDVISSLPFYHQPPPPPPASCYAPRLSPPTPAPTDLSITAASAADSDSGVSSAHSPIHAESCASSSPGDDLHGGSDSNADIIINVGYDTPVMSPTARSHAGSEASSGSLSSPGPTSSKKMGGSTGFQDGVTVGYTYDAFFISDGRSRSKKNPTAAAAAAAAAIESSTVRSTTRYTCNECGKDYATSSNLSRHKQTHRSAESGLAKQCPHCGKLYVSMPALSMHILTHSLRHQCTVCNKSFSRPWLLQGHMRSHTGEKPYGCAHCGKAFADRSNLRAHMQTHSAYKNYECKRCNKTFALKSYLNKHYESACFRDDAAGALEAMDALSVASSCEL